MDKEYYKEQAVFLLKIISGLIIGIFITFCFPPLILLDILLIPALLFFVFMLIITPFIMILDFLFPNRFEGAFDDDYSYTESSTDEDKHNLDIPITGDHFFPRKDGFCTHQYSEACITCARRKKSFGTYTMGYHCYM